jgi:hypothetical protein
MFISNSCAGLPGSFEAPALHAAALSALRASNREIHTSVLRFWRSQPAGRGLAPGWLAAHCEAPSS